VLRALDIEELPETPNAKKIEHPSLGGSDQETTIVSDDCIQREDDSQFLNSEHHIPRLSSDASITRWKLGSEEEYGSVNLKNFCAISVIKRLRIKRLLEHKS